jgi:DNA-binding CsgD family transcriptional regulator
MAPVAAARAEAFWLEGAHEAIVEATEAALSLAIRRGANWFTGDLMVWRWRAGVREAPPELAEPYDLQLAGEWRRASERWSARGCHYEAALALGDADDDDALRRSLEDLLHLGGRPAAAIVTRRLRERGARSLPRGPRATTRRNLAGLTSRELDVLRLIMLDLPNAEIARRLFLAEKTVDHHVSSILRKLAVSTRRQARTKAAQLGLAGKDR